MQELMLLTLQISDLTYFFFNEESELYTPLLSIFNFEVKFLLLTAFLYKKILDLNCFKFFFSLLKLIDEGS